MAAPTTKFGYGGIVGQDKKRKLFGNSLLLFIQLCGNTEEYIIKDISDKSPDFIEEISENLNKSAFVHNYLLHKNLLPITL